MVQFDEAKLMELAREASGRLPQASPEATLTDRDLELAVAECMLQSATSRQQIWGMVAALALAKRSAVEHVPTALDISDALELEMQLAELIESRHKHYRSVPVVFGNGRPAITPELVVIQMLRWAGAFVDQQLPPVELYRQYEETHPHADGNGRNGFCTWAMSVYWQTGRWPTELPPDIFGQLGLPRQTDSAFGPIERD